MRFWFPVIVYSGIIFFTSSVPNVRTPLAAFDFDKVLHLIEYAPFGFLVARAMGGTRVLISKRALWAGVVLISFLYAASDEFHQSFVPGRNSGVFDLIADTVGGVMGGYLYMVLAQRILEK